MTIEEACEIMHDAYEEAAVAAGWETQERSRKPWADVPEANKETMRAAVRALLTAVVPDIQNDLDTERTFTEGGTELGQRVRDLAAAAETPQARDHIETLALEVDGTVRYALRAQETAQNTAISVYPVGMMSILLALRYGWPKGQFVWRFHLRNLRERWRKRSFWNGFLAEVDYPPAGLAHTRAGHGWTRRRAARDLGYALWKDNQR